MTKDELIDLVIEQIRNCFESEDYTAMAELLDFIPSEILMAFLPEEMCSTINLTGE
jgi:hypothetical protein